MGAEAQLTREGEQPLLVRADKMDHRLVVDAMAVKPNAAIEGEAHPIAAAREFLVGTVYEQEMLPSTSAVPMGTAVPEKT